MYKDTVQHIGETLTALQILLLSVQTEWVDVKSDSDRTALVDINADIRQLSQTLLRIGGSEVRDSLAWLSDNKTHLSAPLS